MQLFMSDSPAISHPNYRGCPGLRQAYRLRELTLPGSPIKNEKHFPLPLPLWGEGRKQPGLQVQKAWLPVKLGELATCLCVSCEAVSP